MMRKDGPNFFPSGLLQPVPEGDYEALVRIMGYLMHVKDRTVTTDDMFQPLTETIELLKFYDMDIPEEVNVLLQVIVVLIAIDTNRYYYLHF